jgi:uncharacterized membrane protein YkvA (DUF1232 family)
MLSRWRVRAAVLRNDLAAVALALSDSRVPWQAKVVGFLVVAYAFSPIDLVPDFIPFAGALDDLLVLPLGIALVMRWIPVEVIADCRTRTQEFKRRAVWIGAGATMIGLVWLALAFVVGRWLLRWIGWW